MDCLESAHCTRVLVTFAAVSLVSRIGAWLKIFAALGTSDNLVDLVMTVQGFLIFVTKAAAVAPGPPIIFTCTAGVWVLTWWRDWMLQFIGGGNNVSSYLNSLLQRLSRELSIIVRNQNMGH